MPLEFSCPCGARFRVDEAMAGKRARCKACQRSFRIPATLPAAASQAGIDAAGPAHYSPNPLAPPLHLTPLAQQLDSDVDLKLEREIQRHQTLTHSFASKPGRLRIQYFKHWMSFPLWPTLWTGLLLMPLLIAALEHWSFLFLSLPFVALLSLYWRIQRAKFVSGCINPGVVVSLEPPLVAVLTDLSMGQSETRWWYVKVLQQPLDTMTGNSAEIGTRLASVATYSRGKNREHWIDFSPVVVNCVTWRLSDIARVVATIDKAEWRQLELAVAQLPQPQAPGLFKVESDPEVPRGQVSPTEIARRLSDHLPHGEANRCWLQPPGIPPSLLHTAVTTIAAQSAIGDPLGLILPSSDLSGRWGLFVTTTGVYFRLASGTGSFGWHELIGAGNAADGLEIILTSGRRFRWANELAPFGDRLEAAFDGLAKAQTSRGGVSPAIAAV